MFEGRTYTQTGLGGKVIRFADQDAGVATTTYNHSMPEEGKAEMARRITAALNLTARFSTEQIESLASELNAKDDRHA